MLYGYGVLNNHVPTLKATAMKSGSTSPFLTSLYAVYKAESNANDSLGTYNGTAQGGLTYTAGKSGNAFTFNGTNAYVSLPNDSLNLTNNFSYSFWVKSSDTSSFTAIISNIENSRSPYGFSHGYWYRLSSGKIQASYRDGNNSTEFLTVSTGSVSNGSWNHVAITFNKTNFTTGVKIYINGNLDTTGIPPNSGGTALPIGYSFPMKSCIGALDFNGSVGNFLPNGTMLDEVNIWTKESTSTEITDLYNSGAGKFYPTF